MTHRHLSACTSICEFPILLVYYGFNLKKKKQNKNGNMAVLASIFFGGGGVNEHYEGISFDRISILN